MRFGIYHNAQRWIMQLHLLENKNHVAYQMILKRQFDKILSCLPEYILFRKQCRSRLAGFWQSYLIRFYSVFHAISESTVLIEISEMTWLENRSKSVISIYSAGQRLKCRPPDKRAKPKIILISQPKYMLCVSMGLFFRGTQNMLS